MHGAGVELKVIVASPRGFCAGVARAVAIVERALAMFGPPVYVRHEIVHNAHVVARLRGLGAVFVDDIADIPDGSVTIFSAHGVAAAVEDQAREAHLDVIDATCPLVRKVHIEGRHFAEAGYDVILVGHRGHAEVEGTVGQIAGDVHVVETAGEVGAIVVKDPARVAYLTQTTLSVFETRDVIAALKRRFPGIVGPSVHDICYATENRQRAVIDLVRQAPVVLVVGSRNSSNANRLREVAEQAGAESHLVEDASALDPAWLDGRQVVGLTSSASTPDAALQTVLARLAQLRPLVVEFALGVQEHVHFKIPRRLAPAPSHGVVVAAPPIS